MGEKGVLGVVLSFPMKIMSWNVRGLGRKDKRGKILKLVRDKKLDMLLLQETKKSNVDELLVKSL